MWASFSRPRRRASSWRCSDGRRPRGGRKTEKRMEVFRPFLTARYCAFLPPRLRAIECVTFYLGRWALRFCDGRCSVGGERQKNSPGHAAEQPDRPHLRLAHGTAEREGLPLGYRAAQAAQAEKLWGNRLRHGPPDET